MSRTILALSLASLLASTAGCSNERGNAAERNGATAQAFTVPALKQRPAGLADAEFAKVKQRYDQYSRQIAADPNDVKAHVGIAQLFMNEARVTGDHPYYYPAAQTLLDKALRHAPNDLAALISKGSVLLSLHHFAEALDVAERARMVSPTTAIIYGIICDANVELGRYEQAVAAADKMVALRPDLRSYSRVSYLREIHGEDAAAIEAMKMAVEAGAPGMEDTEWARYTLGMVYANRGRLKEAEAAFATSLAMRPNYPFAIAGLARVRAAQRRGAEALALLDSASGIIPEFSFAEARADIYRASGNTRAADSMVAAVETMLAEDEAAGHYADKEFALLYANHRIKPEEAVARARKELARRPDNIEAQHAMALTLFRAGMHAEARTLMAKAMRMGTHDPVMFAHAGLIEIALGNKARGSELLKRARALNPHLPALLQQEIESHGA